MNHQHSGATEIFCDVCIALDDVITSSWALNSIVWVFDVQLGNMVAACKPQQAVPKPFLYVNGSSLMDPCVGRGSVEDCCYNIVCSFPLFNTMQC